MIDGNYQIQNDQFLDDILKKTMVDSNIEYFSALARRYWRGDIDESKVNIGMTDIYFPEVYIRALGARPIWFLGGNYFSGENADLIFPQISDPTAKSCVGMLLSNELNLSQKCKAILFPIKNDSMRKAYHFIQGTNENIIPISTVPYLLDMPTHEWKQENHKIICRLEKITGRMLEKENLYFAAKEITEAREVLLYLSKLNIPEIIKCFIKQTYYMADDLSRWISEVKKIFNKYPSLLVKPKDNDYGITLMGSPIYLPNKKVLSILDEVEIVVENNLASIPYPNDYSEFIKNVTKRNSVEKLMEYHYKNNYSANMIKIKSQTKVSESMNGIIYHLLKGQLTYAYEAEEIEKYAHENKIPFICVETDYTDADIEQLKIRLEAFGELTSRLKRIAI